MEGLNYIYFFKFVSISIKDFKHVNFLEIPKFLNHIIVLDILSIQQV